MGGFGRAPRWLEPSDPVAFFPPLAAFTGRLPSDSSTSRWILRCLSPTEELPRSAGRAVFCDADFFALSSFASFEVFLPEDVAAGFAIFFLSGIRVSLRFVNARVPRWSWLEQQKARPATSSH